MHYPVLTTQAAAYDISVLNRNWEACNVDEHGRLIATLKSGEVEACRQLVATHLEAVLTRALDGANLADEPSLPAILSQYAGRTAT